MNLPPSSPIGTRDVRARFRTILDEIAGGRHFVVYRGSKPLAAMIPLEDLDHLGELLRRDAALAAVLRAKRCVVEPWETAGIIEAIVSLQEIPPAGRAQSRDGSGLSDSVTPNENPPLIA